MGFAWVFMVSACAPGEKLYNLKLSINLSVNDSGHREWPPLYKTQPYPAARLLLVSRQLTLILSQECALALLNETLAT